MQLNNCEDAIRFQADYLLREPRDWSGRRALAMNRHALAGLYLTAGRREDALVTMKMAAEGGSEAGVRALASWFRTGDGAATIDPAEAERWQRVADGRNWSMKRFTVPAYWWSQQTRSPVYMYILDGGTPENNFLEDEIYGLEVIQGIAIPDDVKSSFRKLWTIAAENNVSFVDLCVYAIGSGSLGGAADRIFAPRTAADGPKIVIQDVEGVFVNVPLAVAIVRTEWGKPDSRTPLKTAFEETAKRSGKALDSLLDLADALDEAGLAEAAELAVTAVVEQDAPVYGSEVVAFNHAKRAAYREHAGRLPEALADSALATLLKPDKVEYMRDFAQLRLNNDIALPTTRELLERARAANPEAAALKVLLGWVYVKSGKVEDGLALLRELVAAYPDAAEPRAYMADGFRRLGRQAEARAALEEARARSPSPSLVRFIDQQQNLLGKR